jgi:mxaJ protein
LCSVFLRAALVLLVAASATGATGAAARELRVCADPNNLPFSNESGEGFENKIVAILADELHAEVSYTWWAQRRGFVRNTLDAGLCDVVPGMVMGADMLRTTRPYYRSGFVFVTRADRNLTIASLDDPQLRILIVGVQLVGDDGSNPPPAMALARRGIVENVRGYTVYGDYSKPNPAGRIVEAVAKGDIDVAIVWGPFAGYVAEQEGAKLSISPVEPQIDGPLLPMVFDISMGVRRDDVALRDEIDTALANRRGEIDRVLAAYGVPRFDQARGNP